MNTHHEANLKEIRGDSHQDVDLPEKIEVEWCHPVVVGDPREEVHQYELAVSLSTVARLLASGGLGLCTALDDNYRGRPASRDSCTTRSEPAQILWNMTTHCNGPHIS